MIFNEENILLALTYLLPGFIITKIITTELLLDSRSTTNDIYKYLLYSVVNISMYSIIDVIFINRFRISITANEQIALFFRNIMMPIIIGFLLSSTMKKSQKYSRKISQSENVTFYKFWYYVNRFYSLLELNRKSQIDDAWDWIFYNLYLNKGATIEIILKDSTIIHAKFGEKSFASYNKSGNKCIFVEKVAEEPDAIDDSDTGLFLYEKEILSIVIPEKFVQKL